MKMTTLIKSFAAEGCDGMFFLLLEDWGRYARYFGCAGYGGGKRVDPPRFLDEESAELLDAVMLKLKKSRPQLWRIIVMRFIRDLSVSEMTAILRDHRKRPKERAGVYRGAHSYGVRLSELDALPFVDEKTVSALLDLAVQLVFTFLQEEEE